MHANGHAGGYDSNHRACCQRNETGSAGCGRAGGKEKGQTNAPTPTSMGWRGGGSRAWYLLAILVLPREATLRHRTGHAAGRLGSAPVDHPVHS